LAIGVWTQGRTCAAFFAELGTSHSGGGRTLVTAGITLIQVARAVKIGFGMTTARALETFEPTQPKQLITTRFLGPKFFLKLSQTESFLMHQFTPNFLSIVNNYSNLPEQKQ
jgi:hypothetical protein